MKLCKRLPNYATIEFELNTTVVKLDDGDESLRRLVSSVFDDDDELFFNILSSTKENLSVSLILYI